MCESQKLFSESVLDGANLFSFSQFSCEELKKIAPSEAIPGFLDGVTTRYCVFFWSVFLPKCLPILTRYANNNQTYLYIPENIMTMAPPPPSEIRPKQDEYSGNIAK